MPTGEDERIGTNFTPVLQAQSPFQGIGKNQAGMTVTATLPGLENVMTGPEDIDRRIKMKNTVNPGVPGQVLHQHILAPAVNAGIVLFPEKYDVYLVVDIRTGLAYVNGRCLGGGWKRTCTRSRLTSRDDLRAHPGQTGPTGEYPAVIGDQFAECIRYRNRIVQNPVDGILQPGQVGGVAVFT